MFLLKEPPAKFDVSWWEGTIYVNRFMFRMYVCIYIYTYIISLGCKTGGGGVKLAADCGRNCTVASEYEFVPAR